MKLLLKRTDKELNYTQGNLSIDSVYFCDTLESPDRNLTSETPEETIKQIKTKGNTAIPTGTYPITLDIVSSKYASNPFMQTYANGSRLPRLLNVPGFDGILIHTGNNAETDCAGCILVGKSNNSGRLVSSKDTFQKLYVKLKSATDSISITIED